MKCNKIQHLILTDYLDGRMDEKSRAEIDKHMEKCPECKDLYLAARDLMAGPLRASGNAPLPGDLYAKVLSRIRQAEQHSSLWHAVLARRVIIPAISIAAAALIIVGAYVASISLKNASFILASNGIENITVLEESTSDTENNQASLNFGSTAEEYFL